MSESTNPSSEPTKSPAHPRHIAVVVKIGRERRPTGTTEFSGNLILHEGTDGIHKDLERIRRSGYYLIDSLVAKLREKGWGAAKAGPQAWDRHGQPIEPTEDTEDQDNGG